jgi:phospholipid/cholesterol/gamma-HCH transport system permease protein
MMGGLEKIGTVLMKRLQALQDTFAFSYQVLVHMLLPSTYNPAVRMVLTYQIYFTSVQILPLFLTISLIFGTIMVGVAGDYLRSIGLFQFFGTMLMGFIIKEIAPFVTVLLIALRSGAAINTEIAVMKANREIAALEAFHINVVKYLFVPRVLNGIISVTMLSFIFSTCVVLTGLFSSYFFFNLSFADYFSILVDAFSLGDMVVMVIKCIILGFFIVFIPIKFGMSATHELTSIPIAVLNGMVQVFISIILIEVLTLILNSLIVKLI